MDTRYDYSVRITHFRLPGVCIEWLYDNRSGKAVTKNTELSTMNRLLSEMQNHASSWPFREPVKLSDAADYYDVIEQPMGPSSTLSSSLLRS